MLGDKEAVVILDLGMGEAQLKECERMCRSCEGLYLCSRGEFEELASRKDI